MQQSDTKVAPGNAAHNAPKYTTEQIAELAEVSTKTLSRWVRLTLIRPPAKQTIYRHLWSEENLQNIRNYKEAKMRR